MNKAYVIKIVESNSKPIIWYKLSIPKFIRITDFWRIFSKMVNKKINYEGKYRYFQEIENESVKADFNDGSYKITIENEFKTDKRIELINISNELKRKNNFEEKKLETIYIHEISDELIFHNMISYFFKEEDINVLKEFYDYLYENDKLNDEHLYQDYASIINMYSKLVNKNDISYERVIKLFGIKNIFDLSRIEQFYEYLELFDKDREYGGFDKDYYIANIGGISPIDEIIFYFGYILSEIMFRFGIYDKEDDDFIKRIIVRIAKSLKDDFLKYNEKNEEKILKYLEERFLETAREIVTFVAKDKIEDIIYYSKDNIDLLIENNIDKFTGTINLIINMDEDKVKIGSLRYFLEIQDIEKLNYLFTKYEILNEDMIKEDKITHMQNVLPNVFATYIPFFETIDFEDLLEITKNETMSTQSFNVSDYLIDSGFLYEIYYEGEYYSYLPKELATVLVTFANNPELVEYREKMQEALLYIRIRLFVYGIVPLTELQEAIEDDLGIDFEIKQFESLVDFISSSYEGYEYSDHLCHFELSNPSLLLNYLSSDRIMPFYKVTQEDSQKIIDNNFGIDRKLIHELFEIFKRSDNKEIGFDEMIELSLEILFMLKSGLKPDDTIELIDESLYNSNDRQEVLRIVNSIWDDSNIWILKGNKPQNILQ